MLLIQGPVGFIGLGNMGAPMAKNLLDSGCAVIVHDMYPEAVADLKRLGAETASSPSDVASRTKQIVTMLPSRYSLPFFIVKLSKKCIWQAIIYCTFSGYLYIELTKYVLHFSPNVQDVYVGEHGILKYVL